MKAGDIIGPYVVLEPLGHGGMGEVYRARDTRLDREVALKRLSDPELAGDLGRRRVLNEARAAGALTHPNIAAIHDVLDTPDGLLIVMEYVPGEALSARLQRGPLSVDEALRIAREIADALAEAHERGIVHRDLKPANVIVETGGRPKILDFGIAHASPAAPGPPSRDDVRTEAGQIIGTPGYMAPEQLAGGPADARTDVYGLGVLLFEMLTGRRPFDASDYVGYALAVFEGPLPRVSDTASHLPAQVTELVARAMARRPEDRFPDAREFSGAIQQAQHELSNADTVLMQPLRPRAWWKSPVAAAVTVGVLLVAIAAGTRDRWWPQSQAVRSPVIGVMPFRNESGNPADAALVVGLSDAVRKQLSAVRELRVLPLEEAREASREQPNPEKLVRVLGARYLVAGALRRSGDDLAVDVSLVLDDGTSRQVGQFKGAVSRLFDLHRQVAVGLLRVLAGEGVDGAAAPTDSEPPTANQEAYADYAQARTFLERPDVPGNLDRAITLFQSATRRDDRFALAYAGLGQAYWAQYHETKDPSWTVKAQAANLDALRIDPAQPEVRMALAVMYEGLGRPKDAIEELQQILVEQPGNDSAHLLLSKIHADRSEWDAAVAEAQQAIALRPNYWMNYVELGETLSRAGKLNEAIAVCRRAVELQPDSARPLQRLGTMLQRAGRMDEANETYERIATIRASWAAYSNVGTRYYWQGNIPEAIVWYRRAIALAPNEPDPYANLGDALLKRGQKEEAAQNYRLAVQRIRKKLSVNEQDANALISLALYQAKLGEKDAAAGNRRKALALAPEDGDVLYNSAVVHVLAAQLPAACETLTNAMKHGTPAVIVQHADELLPLKRKCPAYDAVVNSTK